MQTLRPAVAALLALAIVVPCALTGATSAPPPGNGKGGAGNAPGGAGTDSAKPGGKKGKAAAKSPLAPISKEDRNALSVNLDYRIPAPTADLVWVGTEPMTVEDFKGKVTVIQTFGGKQSLRTTLERAKKAMPEGVTLLGLHTPEEVDDAPKAGAANLPCPVAVDPSGAWCDALGVWTTPVNIVVNKGGAIAAVALTDDGLRDLLPQLLAEDASEFSEAPERPTKEGAAPAEPAAPPPPDVSWPTFDAKVSAASDMRGKKMPAFSVAKWLSPKPDPGTRLVAMDFWATWCPPCRAAIPHLNELNGKFGSDVLFVGISDEEEKAFNAGLKKYKLAESSFRYSVALDPDATMKKFFGISGIPHLAIASADGVVRWQGHPMELKEDDLQKLIDANRQANPAGTKAGTPAKASKVRGWANRAPQKSR